MASIYDSERFAAAANPTAGQFDRRNALSDELAANKARIAELKTELASLTTTTADMDSLDRALAANRARIGDLGNSRAHLQDIQNRFQWNWQANQSRLAKEEDLKKQLQHQISTLVGNIEDLDVLLANPQTSPAERDALLAKRNRMVKELSGYGVEYNAANVQSADDGNKPMTLVEWDKSLIAAKDKEGNVKSADLDDLEKQLDKIPGDSSEKNSRIESIKELRKHTQEIVKERRAKQKQKIDAAVQAAKEAYPDDYTPISGKFTKDGIVVEIRKENGRNHYFVGGKEY